MKFDLLDCSRRRREELYWKKEDKNGRGMKYVEWNKNERIRVEEEGVGRK